MVSPHELRVGLGGLATKKEAFGLEQLYIALMRTADPEHGYNMTDAYSCKTGRFLDPVITIVARSPSSRGHAPPWGKSMTTLLVPEREVAWQILVLKQRG